MNDQADDLKKLRIRPEKNRRHLPTLGPHPLEGDAREINEVVGGSGVAPTGPVDTDALRERVVEALKHVYDPEIPINIYDLGLIYGIDVDPEARVRVRMTLTAPACPVAGALVEDVARRVGKTEGVSQSRVELVWDPPWTKDRMTEEALLELGLL